jgi:cation transporter-like permease
MGVSNPVQDGEDAGAAHEAALAAHEKSRRRRLLVATLLLLIGLPIYLMVVAWTLGALTAPTVAPDGSLIEAKPLHWAVEALIYLGFGLVWAFPMKRLVKGLGKRPPVA